MTCERKTVESRRRAVRVSTPRVRAVGQRGDRLLNVATKHSSMLELNEHDHPLYVRHVDFTGPAGALAKLADESYEVVKWSFDQALEPTAGDDETQGYAVNSWWFTTAKTAHVCAFAGEGVAVWRAA